MEYNKLINEKRHELDTLRFTNELEYLKKNKPDEISKIENIQTFLDTSKTSIPKKENKMDKLFDEIDKRAFNKPWNKLTSYHKLIKLKDYIQESFDANKAQELIKTVTLQLEEGKLSSCKDVIYDQSTEKIKNIPKFKNI